MKKKIVSMALAMVLALSLCACANKEAGNTAAAADTSTAAGSSAAAEENTSKELTKLSLGTSPWPTNMFFYLADRFLYLCLIRNNCAVCSGSGVFRRTGNG